VNDIFLNDLPYSHILRNVPLIDINAVYQPIGSKAWREVFPAFGIANKTFNELAECWTGDRFKTSSEYAHKLAEQYEETRMNIIGRNGNEGLHYEV
jgi:hypothetical protein